MGVHPVALGTYTELRYAGQDESNETASNETAFISLQAAHLTSTETESRAPQRV
jgi:hypothetical protein